MHTDKTKADTAAVAEDGETAPSAVPDTGASVAAPREVNGPKGPEPTRYGDWEQKGRCSDF